MEGIDEADQLQGYYHVRLKCTKNYVFWFMFDVATTNSFILYCNNRHTNDSQAVSSEAC